MVLVLVLPAGAWPSLGLSRRPCVHCCRPPWPPAATPGPHTPLSEQAPWVGLPRVRPTIDISILKAASAWLPLWRVVSHCPEKQIGALTDEETQAGEK
ncbi:hypothetical protein GHT09_016742 [Marmota monax]|uniref:Secreted protein n=1 Tax=Marmota monax TaxID=9995 RepID=A0A834UUK5_MARMO|nr:hypothetical protein GHT09_016742 [Marmota monax]